MKTNDAYLLLCEQRRREWRARFHSRRKSSQPLRQPGIPVSVAAVRSWKPEDKAPDAAMNTVLELILHEGRVTQADLSKAVSETLNVKIGTARAYVSASLLMFREAGWVRCVTKPGDKKPVWEVEQ